MALRLQQNKNHSESSTTVSCAFSSNIIAGHLIIIAVVTGLNTHAFVAGDISKSAGTATLGAFTLDKVSNDTVQGIEVAVYSAPVTGTGSCTILISNLSAGLNFNAIGVAEYYGLDLSATRVNATSAALGSGAAADSGNAASGGAGVFIGALTTTQNTNTTITEDAAFSLIEEYEDSTLTESFSFIDRIVSGATTDSASWTIGSSSYSWNAVVVTYKAQAFLPILSRSNFPMCGRNLTEGSY